MPSNLLPEDTVVREVSLLDYWMPVLRNLKEFQEIAKALEPEIVLLLEVIDQTLNNMFIATSDEIGTARFEKIAEIYSEDGSDLDTRKFNVQVKWNEDAYYTLERLKNQLYVICGNNNYTAKMDYDNYELTVKLGLENAGCLETVKKFLTRVLPANITYQVMLYNTYAMISDFTHEQLSAYTHQELREDLLQ